MIVLRLARFVVAPAVMCAVIHFAAPNPTATATPPQVIAIAAALMVATTANLYMAMKEDN